MGRQSSFTPQQTAHIDTYMDEFEAKVAEFDPEMKGRNASLKAWKEATATEIMSSSLFDSQLVFTDKKTPQWWYEQVVRRFNNRASKMRKPTQKSHTNESGDQLFTSLSLTGRKLFEQQHKDEINAEATKRRKGSKDGESHAGFYQATLKDMWEATEDQEAYEDKAEAISSDIAKCMYYIVAFSHP